MMWKRQSMEKLLDLSASTLENSDYVLSMAAQNPTRKSLDLGALQCQQESTSRASAIGKREKDRNDLQKEILKSLFNVPERAEEAPKRIHTVRTRAYGHVVTEPLKETTPPFRKTVTVKAKVTEDEDDESENSYEVLRKAVKEYWNTMKEYYEAAVDSFAKGDLDRAYKLLEEGQFFMKKAREADERSAQKLIQTRDEIEEVSIDLQDHEPRGAIRLLKSHLTSLSGIPSIQYLKLTVGTNGSNAKEGARKRLILKLLEKESIKWTEEGDGWIIVIRVDQINPKSLKFAK
ncbi:hypothetical protein LguiA_023133 [Lonicera macranthoides]